MIRTGIGFDVHRFAEGRRLVLGGVAIEHERGLAGHSDADALTHAVIDAMLGAAAMGDIGHHFPDDDERFRDADSLGLAREAANRLRAAGYEPENVDATVVLEAPKLAPHRDLMCERVARALGLPPDRVSVKATRGEGMGFVGREEGIAALAVATVRSVTPSRAT